MHYFHKIMFNKYLFLSFIFIISGCSAVVEPIEIAGLSPDPKSQEHFSVEVIPLTFAMAKELNLQRFPRLLSSPGNAYSAKVVDEKSIARSQLPPDAETFSYVLGVGDGLAFTQPINTPPELIASPIQGGGTENSQFTMSLSQPSSSIVKTTSRVGSDGSILLIGVGRLQAKGRQISDLQDDVRSILIQNGKAPDFQLEIESFNSQRIFLTSDLPEVIDAKGSLILPITDQGLSLREAIASAGLPLNEKVLTLLKIKRGGKIYQSTLSDVLSEKSPDIYLEHNDHIFIQNLAYLPGKVFLTGAVDPIIIPINPEERQTLAEVLFAKQGPMAVEKAQRSGVYLLRGQNPLKAYHLDAQNPARILVADNVELRPNDIVFVGEQPISTFNRVLSTIFPLRIFSRDVQNNNIP